MTNLTVSPGSKPVPRSSLKLPLLLLLKMPELTVLHALDNASACSLAVVPITSARIGPRRKAGLHAKPRALEAITTSLPPEMNDA
jgi:hypothetical protein